MKDIIIAYPVKETAMQLRSLLENEGFHVSHICARGSSVLGIAQTLNEGVIVCSFNSQQIWVQVSLQKICLSALMLVALSKNGIPEYMGNLVSLALPVNKEEFLQTVAVLVSTRSSFTQRNNDDSELLSKAKLILMKTNDMGEIAAHKYLQQESMKKGKKLQR